jgi:hypothetical protein
MRRLLLVWLLLAPACSADGDDAAAERPVQDSAIIPEGWHTAPHLFADGERVVTFRDHGLSSKTVEAQLQKALAP